MPTHEQWPGSNAKPYDPKWMKKWFESKGVACGAGFDHLAYKRMAEDLVQSMAAVGGAGQVFEMYVALMKTLALIIASQTRDADFDLIAEVCMNTSLILYDEIVACRAAATKDLSRKVPRRG